jgi:intergrase/recombinase
MKREPQGTIRQRGFVFHGLRKNACNKLFEVGCTEKEVEAITGQSAAMVAHYSKKANQLKAQWKKWRAERKMHWICNAALQCPVTSCYFYQLTL